MTQNGLSVSGRVFCKYCPGLKNLSVTRIAPGVHTPGTPGSLKSKKTAFFGSKWLWISTKIGRGHLQAMAHLFKKYKTHTMYPCWVIVFTSFFTFWPLVTPNDLWPPPKTIGIIYSIWPTHTLHMLSLTFTLLEISCLQGFDLLISHDPKWPLTSTKMLGIIFSIWAIYLPSMRILQVTLLEIPCKQAIYKVFTIWPPVTSNDLWAPR